MFQFETFIVVQSKICLFVNKNTFKSEYVLQQVNTLLRFYFLKQC